MEKTHNEIETNIMVGKSASYMQPYDNLPQRTTATECLSAVRLAEGLADDHCDQSLVCLIVSTR